MSKVVYLSSKEYIPYEGAQGNGMRRTTTLFSTFPPDELFLTLTTILKEEAQDYELKEPYWKIIFTVQKQIQGTFYEQVKMQVEI